ncbi:ice-binding family protein [Rhodopseudomonas palustris]|uniref:Outer membrane autotransporter barrel n=1 Tax=Rhodopseudomonas palustris (strain BisB18) TaxID=316056 RepID=Q214C9_RHOPB
MFAFGADCLSVRSSCRDGRSIRRAVTRARRLGWPLACLTALCVPSAAWAQTPNLGSAANFAVLAGSAVSNTGPTTLIGSLGLSPGSSVSGFPPGMVTAPGGIYIGDAIAIQAQIDLASGYNAIASRPTTADLTGQNLGGLTLTPGVYNFASTAQLTGALTLNALGNPNAIFIFNIGSSLTTGSAASVTVIGGGLGSNVYWRVGSSATLGTTTAFVGDILALSSITLNTGANISCGSALARNGAVTLDTNTIAARAFSSCVQAALLPTDSGVTPAQSGMAGLVNNAFANAIGNGNNLPQGFLNLSALTPEMLAIVLRQLFGEGGTGIAQGGILAMNSFLSMVLNPYANGMMSDGRAGFGPAQPVVRTLGYAPDSRMATKAPAAAAIDRGLLGGSDQRWGSWGAVYGGKTETRGLTALDTSDRSSRGFGVSAGLDYRLLPDTIVGVAVGGGTTNYALGNGLGSGHSDMFQTALYSSTRIHAAYVSAAVAYAWHDVTTDQFLSVATADHLTAHFNANNLGARIEAGYRFAVPGVWMVPEFGITPYGALQAQAFRTPSYAENINSDFARSFAARTETAVRTELGAWFDQANLLDDGNVLILRSRAAWAHDRTSTPTMNAAFLALPGSNFTVYGATPAGDLLLATVASELRFRNGFSVAAQLDGEFAERATRYGGTGRVRYSW